MTAAAPQRTLADVASDVATGAATPAELHVALRSATVYCERTEQVGFRALGAPGEGVVPVFSSPEQLALARGPVDWFAMPGDDLLDLLPDGYDLLLDMGGSAPLRLRPSALDARVAIDVAVSDDRALGGAG